MNVDGSAVIQRIVEPEIDRKLADEVRSVLRGCFDDYPDRTYFKLPPHFRYLVMDGDAVVAQMGVEFRIVRVGESVIRTFGVVDLCVRDGRRSSGLAGRLLAEVAAYASACAIDFVLLFADDARLYAAHGWVPATNPVTWVKIHEHRTLGLAEEIRIPEMMIKATGDRGWPVGVVDLLGHMF